LRIAKLGDLPVDITPPILQVKTQHSG